MEFEQLPDQIKWKVYRAKDHFDAFIAALEPWMNNTEFKLVPAPSSTPHNPVFVLAPPNGIPARFGLIAGDFLQNLRSVLDYLVWEMILANGKEPNEKITAFPICSSANSFKEAKRKLAGVPIEAIEIIESLQPYPERRQVPHHPLRLEVLDELNNANKHRRVLLTSLASVVKPDQPIYSPHVELEVTRFRGGDVVPGERLLAFLTFETGPVKGAEVTDVLTILSNYIGVEVLPLFDRFL